MAVLCIALLIGRRMELADAVYSYWSIMLKQLCALHLNITNRHDIASELLRCRLLISGNLVARYASSSTDSSAGRLQGSEFCI